MESSFIFEWKRTHNCGALGKKHVGNDVVLNGWVATIRDHGNLFFILLRDRYGEIQTILDSKENERLYNTVKNLANEYVIAIKGTVRERPKEMANSNMQAGEIEVYIKDIKVLNSAEVLPFSINDEAEAADSLRLKYRYLDLRRSKSKQLIIDRARISSLIRRAMESREFLDIETPFLYKSTPEGAREFIVPSRVHPGSFYALPQSPQTFKQVLMISGFDKYYQLVKCFRDEDFRADRQPEFTQLDCELSFIEQTDILKIFSEVVTEVVNGFFGKNFITKDFPIMTYQEAMDNFGCDKPDLRFDLKLKDITGLVKDCSFKVFNEIAKSGGIVNVLCLKKEAQNTSRKKIDEYESIVKKRGLKGLAWAKVGENNTWQSSIAKFFDDEQIQGINSFIDCESGDLLLFGAGEYNKVKAALSDLRVHLGSVLNLNNTKELKFLWVVDFPLLEKDKEGRLKAMHHPFTAPLDEDQKFLSDSPEKVKAKAYDLVCNGWEIGGGSIRIHQKDLQDRVFKVLGLTKQEIEKKFGFLLEALKYGAPPHGGIAFGLDRFVMILTGCSGIRDLIPFPKTQKASCLMTSSPSRISEEVLDELSLTVNESLK